MNSILDGLLLKLKASFRSRGRFQTHLSSVPLCGHATLASAHVLFSHGSAAPSVSLPFAPSGEKVTFHTLSGPLPVQRVQEG